MSVEWESQEGGKRKKGKKNNGWNNCQKLPKHDEKHTSSHLSLMSYKRDKLKGSHAQAYHNQTPKSQRENFERSKRKVTYQIQGFLKRVEDDFSSEIMEARREWDDVFKAMKDNQSRILYVPKSSFRNEGKIKTFPAKQKLRDYVTSRPVQQEILNSFPSEWKKSTVTESTWRNKEHLSECLGGSVT